MEIGLNIQENTKTSEFVNFSIRDYVAEIRKKDRKKCWPFGSLGDPDKYDVFAFYQSVESSNVCDQSCPGDHINGSDDKPQHKEASNSSNKETSNGKKDQSQTTDMIESLGINDNMGKRINNEYPDSNSSKVIYKAQNRPEYSGDESGDNVEPGRNRPKRRHQRLRLLSDILRNLDNVNTRFATETEDESDDVTLDAFFRKPKGVEVITMSTQKMTINHVEEPNFEKEEKSKSVSKYSNENDSKIGPVSGSRKTRIDDVDFQTMAKRKKVGPPEKNGTEPTETANEDSEMEAVMLLATHFNEENPSSPVDGGNRAQMVQSNMGVESLEASKRIITSPLKSSSGGYDQGFAMGTTCACVQKKIRAGNESIPMFYTPTNLFKTATKDPTIYDSVFQKPVTLVCSINRNPADFSIPNAENVFMRGG